MINNSKALILLFIALMVFGNRVCAVNMGDPIIFSSGNAEIKLQDHLHHPLYWWPNTLLSYPIVFNEETDTRNLVLTDKQTGKEYPFQLSDIKSTSDGKKEAVLSFFAALPSGGSYDLLLQKGTPQPYQEVKAEEKGDEIIIQTDKILVAFPASRQGSSGVLPGPVLGIAQSGKSRMGQSVFHAGGRSLERLETKVINRGPLFTEVNIRYLFTDGASYEAAIRCIKGYDFIEIKEQMEGFSAVAPCDWEIDWQGFSPTHRQAPNHPHFSRDGQPESTKPGFGRFNWETIDQKMLSGHLGIIYTKDSTQIPFEINVYGNYPAEKVVTSSAFWDERKMQSVGIFMNNALGWNDLQYAIWHVTDRLSVRFYYREGLLSWRYPVVNGKRSTAMSCYDHQKDIDNMNDVENLYQPRQHPQGFTYHVQMSQLSYNTFLQNRYGTLHLDRVKDWVLNYPDSLSPGPVVFPKGKINSVKELERDFLYGSFVLELPVSGTCQNSGYGPTSNRRFYESWVDAFDRLLPNMSEADRERFCAMFLFHAYVAADEEYMPMRNMLSGHPNFLADVKSTPALAAFLFPKHPAARDWEEMFGEYIALNTHYHIRPAINSWNAAGGRWTENLGTYVWGFLRPTLRANYLLRKYTDSMNYIASDHMAALGSWLMNTLSAPYKGESLDFYRDGQQKLDMHYWGIVTKEKGPRRIHPPQGAHAARRIPSASLWLLGQELKNYDPLLSEHISFVSHPDDQEEEVLNRADESFSFMYPQKEYDPGTPPDFRSVKFTGYGIILRAGVGTPDELSVHLQQVDRGPNYRWGLAADGGCGNIYFYAKGKSYSHNGQEDGGDRRLQDVDLLTNFGVFKDGKFKSVGMNVLDRPMYDLGTGQFAEIAPSKQNSYSWPEYQGRSIMLVGKDYFILYDDVHDNNIAGRLSWFTHPEENLPEINIIRAGGIGTYSSNGKVQKTVLSGKESKGVWYDGSGDFLTFVSHKKGYHTAQTDYGAVITSPEDEKDYIFRNDDPVEVNENGVVFSGTAGFIRNKKSGDQELVLFHGSKIGNTTIEMSTDHRDVGISAIFHNAKDIGGQYYSPEASKIKFRWKGAVPKGIGFYLDGTRQSFDIEGEDLTANIPVGTHVWSLTTGLPDMLRPEIDFTKNEKGKVIFGIHAVQGSDRYRFEYSTDVGKNWTRLKEQSGKAVTIAPLAGEQKGYVRVVALNRTHESPASVVYPVYFTDRQPHYPDGLWLTSEKGKINLSWGSVLGCTEYRLYRKIRNTEKFQLVYQGKIPRFADKSVKPESIYEYAVTAVNGNGESLKSKSIDTDPCSWLNFDPVPGEPFRRSVNLYDGSRDNSGNLVDLYYPE